MISKRFLTVLIVLLMIVSGCQIQAVVGMLDGIWIESYRTSSGETVTLTLTFDKSSESFTWIEKQENLEKSNRTGTYSVYLNDSLTDPASRATVVLQFAAGSDSEAKNVAFWFSFSEKDKKRYLNLKPVSDSEDTCGLEESAE